jgi:hypothetical protein
MCWMAIQADFEQLILFYYFSLRSLMFHFDRLIEVICHVDGDY